jgi:hypothetical protein
MFAGASSENSIIANEVIFNSKSIDFEKELFANVGFKIRTPDYELTTKAFYFYSKKILSNLMKLKEAFTTIGVRF